MRSCANYLAVVHVRVSAGRLVATTSSIAKDELGQTELIDAAAGVVANRAVRLVGREHTLTRASYRPIWLRSVRRESFVSLGERYMIRERIRIESNGRFSFLNKTKLSESV